MRRSDPRRRRRARRDLRGAVLFFRLSTWELVVLIAIVSARRSRHLAGRALHHRTEHLRESFGVLQGALLGLVALLLAFGLSLAVTRYQTRRDAA